MTVNETYLSDVKPIDPTGANCAEDWREWTRKEAAVTRAVEEGEKVYALPLLAMCATCPILAECNVWAKAENYTGVAGGAVFKSGTPLYDLSRNDVLYRAVKVRKKGVLARYDVVLNGVVMGRVEQVEKTEKVRLTSKVYAGKEQSVTRRFWQVVSPEVGAEHGTRQLAADELLTMIGWG